MRLRMSARLMALGAVIAIGAVACGGSGSTTNPSPTSGTGSASAPGQPHTGGSIILGAEQWPQCLNPITDCASASWYLYTVPSSCSRGWFSGRTTSSRSPAT